MAKIYRVGGCVRDVLLNQPPKDFDYVVVGSSTAEMLAQGYKQVGKDFPVFLDEKGEEYALARTERKTGDRHTDFEVVTENVTLIEDLRRRDLTINAMACADDTGEIIDPFGGRKDIEDGILRHVDDQGFMEDPLRILRIGRFLARYPRFSVAPETTALCTQMCKDGMLKHLTAERVFLEMYKTFRDVGKPSRFFFFLRMVEGLEDTFPEIHALIDVIQPYKHHPEGDVFLHSMMVLEQVSSFGHLFFDIDELWITRFCALTHDLGKAVSPKETLPKHHGHEAAGVPIIKAMAKRLRIPSDARDHAMLVAKYHTHIHNLNKLKPLTIVRMFEELKYQKNKYIRQTLPIVSACDSRGRTEMFTDVTYPNQFVAMRMFQKLSNIRARDICSEEELKNVNTIKRNLEKAAIGVIKTVRANISE